MNSKINNMNNLVNTKKAILVSFDVTTRIIIESEEPTEEDIERAYSRAKQGFLDGGCHTFVSDIVDDTECMYNPETDI